MQLLCITGMVKQTSSLSLLDFSFTSCITQCVHKADETEHTDSVTKVKLLTSAKPRQEQISILTIDTRHHQCTLKVYENAVLNVDSTYFHHRCLVLHLLLRLLHQNHLGRHHDHRRRRHHGRRRHLNTRIKAIYSVIIHIHLHRFTYIFIDLHTSSYIYIHLHTFTYIFIHLHTSSYIYIHLPHSLHNPDLTVKCLDQELISVYLDYFSVFNPSKARKTFGIFAAFLRPDAISVAKTTASKH